MFFLNTKTIFILVILALFASTLLPMLLNYSTLYLCLLFFYAIMLKALFKIFILLPIMLVVNAITILFVGIYSLYKTVSGLDLKQGYPFFMLSFTLAMCYMLSELISSSSGSHFLVVLLSCYAIIVIFSSLYVTYNSKVDNPLLELCGAFTKSSEFFTYNNLDASLKNFSFEIDGENNPSPDL